MLDTAISGLDYDSRRVTDGYLFFAFPGARVDGRAVRRARLWLRAQSRSPANCPRPRDFPAAWVQVEHGRRALALASRKRLYRKLDEKIPLIGITGTNGKTTTSYLVDSILRAAGRPPRCSGTIEYQLACEAAAAAEHDPRIARSLSLLAELDEMDSPQRRDHGGLVARAGVGPRVRLEFPHRESSRI